MIFWMQKNGEVDMELFLEQKFTTNHRERFIFSFRIRANCALSTFHEIKLENCMCQFHKISQINFKQLLFFFPLFS